MLTYPLNKESGRSLYEQLYEGIRRDILSGTLPAHQRLPSKRALAQHLEVSIITVQNAYEQLAAEGYIYSQEKRGYYVSPVERPLQAAARQPAPLPPEPEQTLPQTESTVTQVQPEVTPRQSSRPESRKAQPVLLWILVGFAALAVLSGLAALAAARTPKGKHVKKRQWKKSADKAE